MCNKCYPNEKLRSRLVELGLPRDKHCLAELGEWLPREIKGKNSVGLERLFFFNTWKCNSGLLWRCAYDYYENMNRSKTRIEYLKGADGAIGADTEANARAKMLIWLVENGYLEFKEVDAND